MPIKTLRDEIKQWKSANQPLLEDNTQSTTNNKNKKQLSEMFTLTDDLLTLTDFDELLRHYLTEHRENIKVYADRFLKLAQSIENIGNSESNE